MPKNLKVTLSQFRAFADTGSVDIRPLTILVGENSTGKTSFLAALRYAFSLREQGKSSFFNSPPFDLGSYDDIVHQSGPSSARERFGITINKDVDVARDGTMFSTPQQKFRIKNCTLTISFLSEYGDVALASCRFLFDDIELQYSSTRGERFVVTKSGVPLDLANASKDANRPKLPDDLPKNLSEIIYRLLDIYFNNPQNNKGDFNKKTDSTLMEIIKTFDAFIGYSYDVHSSPPVRSVPRRVYTSADEARFADQPHTPHQLNRLKRADRLRWRRLNAGLSTFGKHSGLFTRFDVTKLTQQDAGPFQLKVTVRGRSSNIADVGYGVSQALPVVTDLIDNGDHKSVFLFQQPEVHLHPRAQAALGTMFSQYIANFPTSYIIAESHSDYLIDRIRIAVRDGAIAPDLVSILYFEPKENNVKINQILIDELGNVRNAPRSYRQFFIAEEEEVLGL